MNIKLHTLDGPVILEGITTIREFPDSEDGHTNIVFATDTEVEYDTDNDFPTMYRFEVSPFSV